MENRPIVIARAFSLRPSQNYLTLGVSAMIFLWMAVFGSWLDNASRLTALVSLGGHHIVVMVLSGAACAILIVIAPLSAGFTRLSERQAALSAGACVLCTIAAAGVLSFLLAALLLRFLVGSLSALLSAR